MPKSEILSTIQPVCDLDNNRKHLTIDGPMCVSEIEAHTIVDPINLNLFPEKIIDLVF